DLCARRHLGRGPRDGLPRRGDGARHVAGCRGRVAVRLEPDARRCRQCRRHGRRGHGSRPLTAVRAGHRDRPVVRGHACARRDQRVLLALVRRRSDEHPLRRRAGRAWSGPRATGRGARRRGGGVRRGASRVRRPQFRSAHRDRTGTPPARRPRCAAVAAEPGDRVVVARRRHAAGRRPARGTARRGDVLGRPHPDDHADRRAPRKPGDGRGPAHLVARGHRRRRDDRDHLGGAVRRLRIPVPCARPRRAHHHSKNPRKDIVTQRVTTSVGRSVPAIVLCGLLAAACGGGGSGDPGDQAESGASAKPHGYVEGAEEASEPQSRLVLADADGGKVGVLDLLSGDVTELDGGAAASGAITDGRFAYLPSGDRTRVIDSGVWTVDHGDHKHYYRAKIAEAGALDGTVTGAWSDTKTTALARDDGTTVLLDREKLEDGEVAEAGTVDGIAVPYEQHVVVAGSGGIVVRDRDGKDVADLDATCTDPRDAAVTTRGVVVGCADGAVLVDE